MGAIERVTVDLPTEVLRDIRASIAAGLYRDVGAALAHHWVAAAAEDDDLEMTAWLNGPGSTAYREFGEGRLVTVSHADLLAQIAADRAAGNPDHPEV